MDNTLNYAVIGYPLGHTMSPFIHKRLLEIIGLEESYKSVELPPEDFAGRFSQIKFSGKLKGCNITIPYKQTVISELDCLDERAELYRAVNTVKFGEKAVGYNTDCFGFLKAVESAGIELCGDILICGGGGAAAMAAFEAVIAGCRITLGVRSSGTERAKKLKDGILAKFPNAAVEYAFYGDIDKDFSLLVNATPSGMYPHTDAMPVSERLLSRCESVYDLVYNPKDTLLIKKARANGSKAESGMSMLVWQAAKAQTIWNGYEFVYSELLPVIEEANTEMERLFR